MTTTVMVREKFYTQNKKATGPDEFPIEIIKLIKEENMVESQSFNLIYNIGMIPEDW